MFRHRTTNGMDLGRPEAEAEKCFMLDYFEDYFAITENIQRGRFIISGRKGSGKSAYVVWMQKKTQKDSNSFCSTILKSDYNLEEIINSSSEIAINYEALFEWIILVRLVRLLLESGVSKNKKEVRALAKFYEKNAGYVNINKYSITEEIKSNGVNIAPLKSNFPFFNRVLGTKAVRAPFYRTIQPLRDSVILLLKNDSFKQISFFLLFDDLDIDLKLTRPNDKKMLLDLIRVAKRYNTEFLEETNAKVLIFLRDDIGDRLGGTDADKSKIFSSYEFCINWYEHDKATIDERDILLRRLINKRLSIAFNKLNYPFDENDPWCSFVEENGEQKSAFKYILDHTFYLPRDLLNIFRDIGNKSLKLPLSHKDINSLLREYAPIKKKEIEDELCVLFDDNTTVKRIFNVLCQIGNTGDVSYHELSKRLEKAGLEKDFITTLLEYSLLVPVDMNNHFYFNYREDLPTRELDDYNYTIPRFLKVFFKII